jgi:hypothetical protein
MKSRKNETPNDATLSARGFAAVMLALFAICCLIQTTNCTPYHPGNFPSYDVLVPSEIVKENPIAFIKVENSEIIKVDWTNEVTKDGTYNLVNDEFLQWAYDLKSEIKRLR